MKSDEKWPVLIVRLLDVADSLCKKMIKHAFKGRNKQPCFSANATSARFVFYWTSEFKFFVFKVKHIVTVGEPLGCALANRCLAARCANLQRRTEPFQATLRSHADTWSGGLDPGSLWPCGSINGGTPKWMVYKGKSMNIPLRWMITRGTPISGSPHVSGLVSTRANWDARRSCTTSMEPLKALAPFC